MVLLTGLTKEPISSRVVNIIALMTEDLLSIVEIQNFQDLPHHGGLVANRYLLIYNSVRLQGRVDEPTKGLTRFSL